MPDQKNEGAGETATPKDSHQSAAGDDLKVASRRDCALVEITEDHVLSILCVRRGREAAIGPELFSDPAWDILLELYAAHLGRRQTTLLELARAIAIPHSTAERWIRILHDRGLIRAAEPRVIGAPIHLSTSGVAVMQRLLAYWGSAFQSI